MSNVISCAKYDYFEIACIHHYEVELTLKSGELVSGIAQNVKTVRHQDERKEILEITHDNKNIEVELIQICKLNVLTDNPHFNEVILDK
ncbi:MAG: Rho-binding antiterminator [Gammaproteobacteria bacterium]|nr:Rho-binding antiterminator [Gammaproteobacteria bacterium]